jgi:hypothetical protein
MIEAMFKFTTSVRIPYNSKKKIIDSHTMKFLDCL